MSGKYPKRWISGRSLALYKNAKSQSGIAFATTIDSSSSFTSLKLTETCHTYFKSFYCKMIRQLGTFCFDIVTLNNLSRKTVQINTKWQNFFEN